MINEQRMLAQVGIALDESIRRTSDQITTEAKRQLRMLAQVGIALDD